MTKNILARKLSTLAIWLITLLVSGLGLSLIIGGNPEIERFRVVFFWRGVELLMLITGIKLGFSTKKISLNVGVIWNLLLLLCIAFISVFFTENIHQSIWGNYYRSDGILTLVHCALFALVVAVNWGKQLTTLLSRSLLVSNTIVSTYVIIWYSIYYMSQSYIPQLLLWQKGVWMLPNENMIAGFLAVSFPLLVREVFSFSKLSPVLKYLRSGSVVLSIVLTQSWGAILTVGVGIVWLVLRRTRVNKKVIFAVIVSLILATSGVVWHVFAGNIVEGRALIFRSLLASVGDKPLVGWGWSMVDAAFESGYTKTFGTYPDLYVDKAHSIWFEYIVTTGIIGLVVYIALQIKCFLLLNNSINDENHILRKAVFFTFLLFIVHSQTNVISIAEEILFWLVVGFCLQKVPLQA